MAGLSRALPRPARVLGLAGLLPFALLAVGSMRGEPGAAAALAAYGASILAFLGAVHWGLALVDAGEQADGPAGWWRFGFGVLPALLAAGALLLPAPADLLLLAAGILATAAVETAFAQALRMPRGYLRLRWGLSAGAAACLLLAAGFG